ncbi:hypothetical protein RHMOL_Rhmol01G0111500 [Rhododendron molle]|uniref:Uncharacterized protein n=1 Tax=Rhododendron molle TaxID=49168 RepID=A0ACC0Q0S2_RHOML|nr:hypothetical protein RHMOL_Rhmol01G0111500 [Rhododendron molle]
MATSLPCSSLNEINKEERDERIKMVEKSYQRYREIISTLPNINGWIGEDMRLYEGFWYRTNHALEGVMCVQEHFKARSDDILLISAPKSGTTWLKSLVFAIMKRACYTNSTHPLLTTNPHDCVPCLELKLFKRSPVADVDDLPSPRIFSTHIPYTSLPESILYSGCKIVYICRDPKDVLISLRYFLAKSKPSTELPPLSFEEVFELFTKGISSYGPIWDHVQGYHKASLECPHRFFFITYEEMKRHTLVNVKRLAEFLEQPFSMVEEREYAVEEIINLCSIDTLKKLEVNKSGLRNSYFPNDAFFRKGEIGDWRNHLTPQMAESIDQITNEKLPGIFD